MSSSRKQGRPFRTDPLPAAPWGAVFHSEVPGYFYCPCYPKWIATAGRQQHERRRVHLTFMRWARHGRLENVQFYECPPLASVYDDYPVIRPIVLPSPEPTPKTPSPGDSGDAPDFPSEEDLVALSASQLVLLSQLPTSSTNTLSHSMGSE